MRTITPDSFDKVKELYHRQLAEVEQLGFKLGYAGHAEKDSIIEQQKKTLATLRALLERARPFAQRFGPGKLSDDLEGFFSTPPAIKQKPAEEGE